MRFGKTFGAERVHAISGKPLDLMPCHLSHDLDSASSNPTCSPAPSALPRCTAISPFSLTGHWATSTASADPTGALDMRKRDWSAEILRRHRRRRGEDAGSGSARQPDRHAHRDGGRTDRTACPDTPVIAGGGDGQCAGTGAGVLRSPGRAYINLGTAVVSGSYGSGLCA